MSVGQRVEVSLTGISGREGLWHSYYPGVIVGKDRDLCYYRVSLDDFDTIWVADWRVFPKRGAEWTYTYRVGDRVDVQLGDLSRAGDQLVPVWWTGTLQEQVGSRYWQVKWDNQADADENPKSLHENLMRTHAPMDWKPLLLPKHCAQCKEKTDRLFNHSHFCPSCYLAIRDYRASESLRRTRRYRARKQWILQLGGLSKKRDARLFAKHEYTSKK